MLSFKQPDTSLCALISLPMQTLTLLSHPCARLTSLVCRAWECLPRGCKFEFNLGLTLCLELKCLSTTLNVTCVLCMFCIGDLFFFFFFWGGGGGGGIYSNSKRLQANCLNNRLIGRIIDFEIF